MEAAASSLSSLLAALRVDGPWTPPATWESISSESGAHRPAAGDRRSRDPIYEPASVPDAALVRLALHALHGVKSSLVEIEELSMLFCSTPADRTSHRITNLWSRSSSTTSLGLILKSIGRTGLAVFFLCKFVHFYLFHSREMNCGSREKEHEDEVCHDNDAGKHPPYSLVNQAFAVAVETVLEGYFCALNTLPASIKLRCSVGQADIPSVVTHGASDNTKIVNSEVTLLEVYLHTEELRRHIKSLGNICFPKFAGLALCQEGLTTDTNLEFQNFPRGADLLSYLYVHLRDADPVHYGYLKYLFIHSCEPYCNFIKSWIYRACVNDPYEEFLVAYTEIKQTPNGAFGSLDNLSLLSVKERNNVSAPCFLKDICHPLLRTGQQLQVLMKLLKLCNLSVNGGGSYISRNIMNLEEILPWFDRSVDSSLNSLTFSKKTIEALVHQREVMYKTMIEKHHYFFSQVEVIPFDTAPSLLCRSMSTPDTVVSDGELMFSANTNALPAVNMSADQKDNDASYTSYDSSDEVDPLESSDCSCSYSSTEEIEAEEVTACDNLSSSMLSSYYASVGGSKSSSVTEKISSSQTTCSVHNVMNPTSPVDDHHKDADLSWNFVPVHLGNKDHNAMPDALEVDYQCGKFWPFGGLLKNNLNSNSDKTSLTEDILHTSNISAGKQVSLDEVLSPFCCKSEPPRLTNSKNGQESLSTNQSWSTGGCYNLSINPMLRNAACHHMESDLQEKRRNQGFPCFDFESVTNPCEVYSRGKISCSNNKSEVGAPMLVRSTAHAHASEQPNISEELLQATVESQANHACSSREMALAENLQANASGITSWEKSLKYVGESIESTAGDSNNALDLLPEMPLDIIIDKCIAQEILLQYKYVSRFTIKLLEDGFDLCGHLLALRRYHFMELADWADSFIISLCRKKWSFVKPEQKRAEIQGLLDLALQRSSCDSDPYKERLFVCMKEQRAVPLAASACGLDVFDSILLGYRVDWPINIIVTEDALKIYAEIFCYLVQVRLSVFSLTEIWRFLKELMEWRSCSKHSRPDVLEDFNSVIRVRHQVYHFLSTLQQYVHCHLSDISWRRFQHSLKHQVRDMLDLESVHLSYLTDALHICFLSVETKPIAAIIKNMLQCALEFRSCFMSLDVNADSGIDQLHLHSLINFSQICAIKTKFERNIKDLYILYSKSPKHGEHGLSRFWGYLNYNEYYSSTISKDMARFYF